MNVRINLHLIYGIDGSHDCTPKCAVLSCGTFWRSIYLFTGLHMVSFQDTVIVFYYSITLSFTPII